MSSQIVAIADAVATSLAGGSFSQPLQVQRLDWWQFDLRDITGLDAIVLPDAEQLRRASRLQWDHQYDVRVVVQKRIDASQTSEIDGMIQLVEEICDHLRSAGRMASAVLTEIAWSPIFDRRLLAQRRVYQTQIVVTYMMERDTD